MLVSAVRLAAALVVIRLRGLVVSVVLKILTLILVAVLVISSVSSSAVLDLRVVRDVGEMSRQISHLVLKMRCSVLRKLFR